MKKNRTQINADFHRFTSFVCVHLRKSASYHFVLGSQINRPDFLF